MTPFSALGRSAGQPRFTTTVPRELVHRAAVAEVLLTSWKRASDTSFTLTAQWPRAHSFFTPVDRCHDPLLAAETIRQAGSLIAHAEFGAPFGHQFLMRSLYYDLTPEHALLGSAPAELDLDLTCPSIRFQGSRLASLHYQVTLRRDGQRVAFGGASFDVITPAVYRRLRGERALRQPPHTTPLPRPAAPAAVGRTAPGDVVLSPTEDPCRWQLRADTGHPVLFDHPVDHVPGMVLIEAARQACRALSPARSFLPTKLESTFTRYAELDSPCWITTEKVSDAETGFETVRVRGRQEGELLYDCLLSSPLPGD